MSPRLSDVLLSSQSDERLVKLARAGHERAFVAIVERYRPELQTLARRLCSDGRGEDVLQQAFLSAYAALSTGAEVRHLRGWLYQIVRNAANRPAGPLCVPLDGAAASATSVEDVVQQRALAMATLSELARLPTRQRQAMIGTALNGRARAEVASSMGLSEGAVRQLVHRARTTLRGAVTAVTPWPLARWIAAVGPDAPGTTRLATGAGAASSGGVAIKLGALLASGTLLTGAAIDLRAAPAHRDHARAATALAARRHAANAHPVMVASVAPAARAEVVLAATERPAIQDRTGGAGGDSVHRDPARPRRRESTPGRSVGRDGSGWPGRRDGNTGRPGRGGSGGDGGRDGGSWVGNSGSDGRQRDGGGDSGARTGGGDAQMASASHTFDSTVRGAGSGQSAGSADGSRSGDSSWSPDGSGAGGGGWGSHDGGSESGAQSAGH